MSDTTKIEKVRVNGVLYDLGGSGGGSNLGLMYPCTILSSLSDKIIEISESNPGEEQDNKKLIISPIDLKNILNSQVDLSELYASGNDLNFYLCFTYVMIGSDNDINFAANNFSLEFTGSGEESVLRVTINGNSNYLIPFPEEVSTWEDVFDNLSEDIKLVYWRYDSSVYNPVYFCDGTETYYGSLYPGLCNLFLQYDNPDGSVTTVPLDVNDFINATEVVLEEEATQSEL